MCKIKILMNECDYVKQLCETQFVLISSWYRIVILNITETLQQVWHQQLAVKGPDWKKTDNASKTGNGKI